MLTKLRDPLNIYFQKIGYIVARLIPSPNVITILGLLFATIFFLLVVILADHMYIVTIIFYVLSISMDVLDGAVARAINKSSKLGSFLDSITDRITDAIYILALYYILNLNPIILFLLLFGCLMISYIRAKAESIGLKMEGIGIAERGDRLILILVILLFNSVSKTIAYYLTLLLLALVLITIGQRIYHYLKNIYFNKEY